MKLFPLPIWLVLGSTLAAAPRPTAPARGDEDAARIAALAHVLETLGEEDLRSLETFLASDFLRGRATPSPELEIAAEFLATQFAAAGLEPGGVDGTWFQPVTLSGKRRGGIPVEASLEIGDVDRAALADSAVVLEGLRDEAFEIPSSDVLLVGSASRLAELAEEQANGKVALVVAVASAGPQIVPLVPAALSSIARAKGLRAVLVLDPSQDSEQERRAIETSRRPSLGRRRGSSPPVLLVPSSLADRLADLSPGEHPLDPEAPSVVGRFTARLPAAEDAEVHVRNVAARLPGSDEGLAHEHVIVSAHYDHIGTRPFGEGDLVNNGADDDASGTVAVALIARTLAMLDVAPRRSVLFLCFCGEELGLLGSRAYAAAPLVPAADTVADVNVEMIGRPDDIGPGRAWITGYEYSELPGLLAEAAAEQGIEVFQHPQFDQQLFTASDNYSLAALGIPAHSFSAGSLHPDYHQPSDEVEKIDFVHMTRIVRALVAGVLRVADREERPAWKVDPNSLRPRGGR